MSQAGSATRVTLYKTELCRNFELSGSCPFGHRCQFAHGTHELRRRALNPRYKTEKCRNFWATGEATARDSRPGRSPFSAGMPDRSMDYETRAALASPLARPPPPPCCRPLPVRQQVPIFAHRLWPC